MKVIQFGPLGQAIAAAFNLKGKVTPALDETIVGTYEPIHFESSPYRTPNGFYAGFITKAAVVGAYSYLGVEPAEGFALVVRALYLYNAAGAVTHYNIGFRKPAYTFLNYGYTGLLAADNATREQISSRSFTADQVGGNVLRTVSYAVPALESILLTFPQPHIVALGGVFNGVIVRPSVQNLEISGGFVGDEYRLP